MTEEQFQALEDLIWAAITLASAFSNNPTGENTAAHEGLEEARERARVLLVEPAEEGDQ